MFNRWWVLRTLISFRVDVVEHVVQRVKRSSSFLSATIAAAAQCSAVECTGAENLCL